MMENALDQAFDAFKIEAESILETAKVLDRGEMQKAVEALAKAERIASSGCGHSGIACRHFAHLMCCAERPAHFISPAEAVHGGLGYMKKGDVMLLVSRGGKTDELLTILDVCKQKGATIIGVSQNDDSILATQSDIYFKIFCEHECDMWDMCASASCNTIAAVWDAVAFTVMRHNGYTKDDLRLTHPGGKVGELLRQEK